MLCPKCDTDMRVNDGGILLEHDDTPEVPTEVYAVQVFTCKNPQCPEYDKEVRERYRLD